MMQEEVKPVQEELVQDPVVKKSLEIAASTIQQIAPIRFPEVNPADILSCPDGKAQRLEQRRKVPSRSSRNKPLQWGSREVNLDFLRRRQALIENLLDPILTEEEVALLICVEKAQVRNLAEKGALNIFKKNASQVFIRFSSVLRFLEQKKEDEKNVSNS